MRTRRTDRSNEASTGVALLLVFITMILVFTTATGARAADQVPSNLDLMLRLCTEAADDIVDKIETRVGRNSVQVRPTSSGEYYEILDDIITRILNDRGVATVDPSTKEPAGAPGEPFVLEYSVPIFRLTYVDVYRSHLVGGKKVKRDTKVRVTAKLLSGAGTVAWIGESNAMFSDRFSLGDIQRVEEGNYTFVKQEVPGSGWGKAVEPVFVSAIVVGLIYLFFSNQSDS